LNINKKYKIKFSEIIIINLSFDLNVVDIQFMNLETGPSTDAEKGADKRRIKVVHCPMTISPQSVSEDVHCRHGH